jgi:hypothetical protein
MASTSSHPALVSLFHHGVGPACAGGAATSGTPSGGKGVGSWQKACSSETE